MTTAVLSGYGAGPYGAGPYATAAVFGSQLAVGFDAPFFTGPATANPTLVPNVYPVALGGHPYLVDTLLNDGWNHTSIPYLRPYFLTTDALGEKNLNPESLWRAAANSWHKGAGQTHLDRTDSDPYRFRASKGVDCWTRNQLSLLPGTAQAVASAATNLALATTGTDLWIADGQNLYTAADPTPVTGTPAAQVTGLASDGHTVYAAYAGAGLWTTTGASATQMVTGTDTFTAVGYVKGRLMAASGPNLYNIVAAGATPAPLFTHPNTDFTWVGFAEGDAVLYAGGVSGDKSLIYRVAVKSDGTALDAPIVAGQLPDGEILLGLAGYLGFVLLGTSKGVRFAAASATGDLTLGALLPTGPSRCFEGQDRFVWFGWDNYDDTSTGLGRMDLSVFNDSLQPAWASDLMVDGQGAVTAVATHGGLRWLAVAGQGVFTQDAGLVAAGTLDTGLIGYDIPDDKIALYLDVRHVEPLIGAHRCYLSVDNSPFTQVGLHTAANPRQLMAVGERRGENFEIRHQLEVDPGGAGPVLTRYTLLSYPAVDSGYLIQVPLLLSEVDDIDGVPRNRDPVAELAYLKGLRDTQKRVLYQEGVTAYSVTVQDLKWVPHNLTQDRRGCNGTCLMQLKTV